MGPLWAEIVNFLEQTRHSEIKSRSQLRDSQIPLLSVYSGHDSTLMPFLATLGPGVWDGVWTPYASMVVIESYFMGKPKNDDVRSRTNFPSGKAFRVVYNGKILTGQICKNAGGPEEELCDLDVLLNLVKPFASFDRGERCMATQRNEPITEIMDCVANTHMGTTVLLGSTILCSAFLSVISVFIFFQKFFRTKVNTH